MVVAVARGLVSVPLSGSVPIVHAVITAQQLALMALLLAVDVRLAMVRVVMVLEVMDREAMDRVAMALAVTDHQAMDRQAIPAITTTMSAAQTPQDRELPNVHRAVPVLAVQCR